jgi:hypothetical protein
MNKLSKPLGEHDPEGPHNKEEKTQSQETGLDHGTLEKSHQDDKREINESNSPKNPYQEFKHPPPEGNLRLGT